MAKRVRLHSSIEENKGYLQLNKDNVAVPHLNNGKRFALRNIQNTNCILGKPTQILPQKVILKQPQANVQPAPPTAKPNAAPQQIYNKSVKLEKRLEVIKEVRALPRHTKVTNLQNDRAANAVAEHNAVGASMRQIPDIDAADGKNLWLLPEYANDIYTHLFSLENELTIRKNFLIDHAEILPNTRAILINWLHEVTCDYKLHLETFQMSVSITDSCLQKDPNFKRSQVQLLGASALLIAAKYEEIMPPSTEDMAYITSETYTVKEVCAMERYILRILNFRLSRPYPLQFLRRFAKAQLLNFHQYEMAKYFIELALLEYELAHVKPSQIAAAAIFLVLNLYRKEPLVMVFNDKLWTDILIWYTSYTAKTLHATAALMAWAASKAPQAKRHSVYATYKKEAHLYIALSPLLSGALIDAIINTVPELEYTKTI